MKPFIKPRQDWTDNISHKKLDKFADHFNASISTTKPEAVTAEGKLGFRLNTGLDGIPALTDAELIIAQATARANGYILTEADDNYDTTTYTMQVL